MLGVYARFSDGISLDYEADATFFQHSNNDAVGSMYSAHRASKSAHYIDDPFCFHPFYRFSNYWLAQTDAFNLLPNNHDKNTQSEVYVKTKKIGISTENQN